jgi:hypothetical protein
MENCLSGSIELTKFLGYVKLSILKPSHLRYSNSASLFFKKNLNQLYFVFLKALGCHVIFHWTVLRSDPCSSLSSSDRINRRDLVGSLIDSPIQRVPTSHGSGGAPPPYQSPPPPPALITSKP